MKTEKARCMGLVALAAIVIPQTEASTISIQQPTFTGLADYQPTGFGQTFTANGKYSIVAIDLYVSSSAGGSDVTLRLYDFNTSLSTLGTTVLSSGSFLESALSPVAAWVRVDLSKPVPANPGGSFAFTVIAKDPGGSSTGWNNYGFNPNNVYSGGSAFGGASGSVNLGTTDLAFRVVTVPEPAPAMTVFVSCLTLITRRKRAHLSRHPQPFETS
jgi:hypothetical protein